MALGINERKEGDSQRKMTYLSDQKKTESPEDSRLWKHFEAIVSNIPCLHLGFVKYLHLLFKRVTRHS